ncbi:MAG: hypothetical protein Q9198_008710 [Flavoplaca austrocitrina]
MDRNLYSGAVVPRGARDYQLDGTITMYVGPDRKKFKFFRNQLLDQGPYFAYQLRAHVDSLEFPEYQTYTF